MGAADGGYKRHGTASTADPADVLLIEQRGRATLLIIKKDSGWWAAWCPGPDGGELAASSVFANRRNGAVKGAADRVSS